MDCTMSQAKNLIKSELVKRGLPFTKVTARTISFEDLARSSGVSVKVHGWKPDTQWQVLKDIAAAHGFFIET